MFERVAFVLVLAALAAVLQPEALAAQDEDRNSVEVFLGGVSKFEDEGTDTGLGLGASYERRLSRWFGVGVLLELTTAGTRDAVLLFPLTLHAYRGLKFLAAPGVEFGAGAVQEFAFRLGTAYEFELTELSLAPEFNVDLIAGEVTLVYGASVGFGF